MHDIIVSFLVIYLVVCALVRTLDYVERELMNQWVDAERRRLERAAARASPKPPPQPTCAVPCDSPGGDGHEPSPDDSVPADPSSPGKST